ncbi:MAG TPA: site-specific DNA-methyltransferase [Polyangiaceae bacterium]
MPELLWKGKREGAARAARRASLRIDEIHGDAGESGAWRNRLVLGEARRVLASLLPEHEGRVALVYVDPPYGTGGSFDYLASIPGAPKEARVAVPAYRDAGDLDGWLAMFADTASLLRRLLADGGSLYVHLDAHVAHYAKVVLDEIFGASAFQREIVWRIGWISGFKSQARSWIRNHDTILFYAKGGRPRTFHKAYVPYPPGYARRDGSPPRGKGHPLEDVWNASEADRLDSIQIMSFSGEKVGYPTQKNEALLARIVAASSDPGDLVLDAFAGSGTTAVVAEKLGRRWIACDASPVAVHATRRRLLRLPSTAPFVLEVDGARSAGALRARARLDGKRCHVEITSFAPPARARASGAAVGVKHWSQWLDGWCVDWEHEGKLLRCASCLARQGARPLPLACEHRYERAGRRVVLVRAYDVLGGVWSRALPVHVR